MLSLDKSATPTDANGDQLLDAGDTIAYTFTLTNTGATSLDQVAVDDPTIDGAGVDCPAAVLAPGATTTCTATYVISSADVAAGSVDNRASATAARLAGGTVSSAADTTSTSFDRVSLGLDKRAGGPQDVDDDGSVGVGDTIAYTFTVTNRGTAPVTGVGVRDAKAGPVTCTQTTLAPGATTECAADQAYVITQADVDAGAVTNVATAAGTGPDGRPVISDPDRTRTTTDGTAAATLVKTALPVVDANGDGRTDAGDRLRFSFTVTNTGTLTLPGVRIDDAMLRGAGVPVTCPSTTLAPGEQVVCLSESYRITGADVAAGAVRNSAAVRASGLPAAGVLGASAVTVPLQAAPGGDDGSNGGGDNGGNGNGNGNGDGGNGNGAGPRGPLAATGALFGPALPALALLLVLAGALVLGPGTRLGKRKKRK